MASGLVSRRTLTFGERVAYQRAIEEVLWRHRIWPKERPDPKPSLDAVMSRAQLEKRVAAYLGKSQLVTDQRGSPITASELQAEMERMASHTKQPDVLRELFAALGNDPFVIAECLARPILVERLVRDLTTGAAPVLFQASSRKSAALPMGNSTGSFDFVQDHVAANLADTAYKFPEISIPKDCIDDAWAATTTVNAPDVREYHTAVWTGSEMIIWGGYNSNGGHVNSLNTGGRYSPSTDSWTATAIANAPLGRSGHTAVWTATEMIVWGGANYPLGDLNSGGRYNPITDSWTATSTANAPAARAAHTAVWAGSEMIVWGGRNNAVWMNSGGRYNPGMDSWIATSTTNAPSARWDHAALWTGSEMIIWGGTDQTNYLHTGGRYSPATNSWTPTGLANVPPGRVGHTAVWSGSEMIVWGGVDETFNVTNTGGRYNPINDTWVATNLGNAPSPRASHTGAWTGSEMIVWGGNDTSGFFNTGGRYNPNMDSWRATTTADAPSARSYPTAVWNGNEMVVWGGLNEIDVLNTGGRYCAQSQAPMAQSAVSRKTHGSAGSFDIALPLNGTAGVECRSGGATNDYQMVINFATAVTVGSASVTSGTGSVSSFSVSGSQVTVNLTGVTDAQTITVTLFNVNDGTNMGNVPVSMGVLVGDVNGNGAVSAADVALTKSQVGMPVGSGNFREDVNTNGTISATDVAQVKANVGTALPP